MAPLMLLILCEHRAGEQFHFLKCRHRLQIWLREWISSKRNQPTRSPQASTVRANGTSFPSRQPWARFSRPAKIQRRPSSLHWFRSSADRGVSRVRRMQSPCSARISQRGEAERCAARGRVPFSAFCSGSASEPALLRRGPRRAAPRPEHLFRPPGCGRWVVCPTWGGCGALGSSRITAAFPASRAGCSGDKSGSRTAVRCRCFDARGKRGGRERMEGLAGAWLARCRLRRAAVRLPGLCCNWNYWEAKARAGLSPAQR